MNREIKFRAWSKKTKKIYNKVRAVHLREKLSWATVERFDPIYHQDVYYNIQPKHCILMQHTGLKDKNGVEIYEGDILKDHGIVAWNDVNNCWSRIDLNWNNRREWHEIDSLTCPFEVIGNIHNNPTLIK